MAIDHPDGTLPIAFVMADVKMPVDIQAQFVTLDINIKSSAVTLTVTVSGTANISISAQSIGVYLQPDWATKEGNSIVLYNLDTNIARGSSVQVSHTVPTGKTLYVNYLAAACYAESAADGDKNQICAVVFAVEGTPKFYAGGNGGVNSPFATPFRVDAGEELIAYVQNWANHNCRMGITVMGYEV